MNRVRVGVVAASEFSGKPVELLDDGNIIGSGTLSSSGGQASAALVLPMPPLGRSYRPLSVRVGGQIMAALSLPDADTLRGNALADAPLLFKGSVFAGERFPACEFDDPKLVDDLFGPYTLHATFYDAQFNAVTSAAGPGRYGAVVEVRSEDGRKTFKRYCTLFRQARAIDASSTQDATPPQWPVQLGISEEVVQRQGPAVSAHFWRMLHESFTRDPSSAVLLSWLFETPSDGPPALERNNAAERDRQWWYQLKRKIGDRPPLKYLSYLPKEYERDSTTRWPLVLSLHGAGERGSDLSQLKIYGIPLLCEQGKGNSFIAICPQCRLRETWLAVELNELLDEVCAKYRVDPDRIYITGASMGGVGTWSLLQQFPNRFAAIAPVCGHGDTDDVAQIKDVAVWMFHGEKDPVVPFSRDQAMLAALTHIGGRAKLTSYPGVGHECWNAAYATPELIPWLLEQRRGKSSERPAKAQP